MKNIMLILVVFLMASCASIKPAQTYRPNSTWKSNYENVGKIIGVTERNGYSIVTVEDLVTPIYIEGRMKIKKPFKPAFVKKEYSRTTGELYHYYFVYDDERYLVDSKLTDS